MPEVVDAVVTHGERTLETAPLRAEPNARLVPEAHRVDFHLVVVVQAVRVLLVVADPDPHDRAAAGHLGLDDHAGLGRNPDGQQRAGQPAVRRPDVETRVDDVAADRITRGLRQVRIAVLFPKGVDLVRPAVVVGVGEAAVAREPLPPVEPAVPARDATDLMVADREVGDDLLDVPVDPIDLPDVLRVLGDVDLVVFGAVPDLVHHEVEHPDPDILEVLAVLVEDLDMRAADRVLDPLASVLVFERTKQVAGDRHPHVTLAVHGGRARRVQAGHEHVDLVALRHHDLARIWLVGDPRHPAAGDRCPRLILSDRQRHDQQAGGGGGQHHIP